MKLSIIIVSWNTKALLEACLASIYRDDPVAGLDAPFEVLVVDNGSTDGSREMVQLSFPQVTLISSNENLGFARGNNLAIRQSRGEYVMLLNPDTVVKPGALQTLVQHLDENPAIGANGPRLLNPDGSLQKSCYPRPTLGRELWRLLHLDRFHSFGIYAMERWPLDRPRPVDVLMGACLLVRRKVLEQVGLLDEQYFIYTEEVDLCTRIQRAGWGLIWVPQAQVVHYGGQSTQQVAREMFLNLYRSKILYFRKHNGGPSARVYKLILSAAALIRLTATPLALFEAPDERQRHLTLSSHYRSLLASLPGM